MKLERKFFERKADEVARDLLGKFIVRKFESKRILKGKIVEVEAYFGAEDPASRACQNGDLKLTMEMEAGTILVYGVHNSWLLNFVCDKKGVASAVLIRAVELLKENGNCKGPGLFCKTFGIDKTFHKKNICENKDIWLEDSDEREFEISESFRIGIKKDLERKMRFFIKGNKFVSGKRS